MKRLQIVPVLLVFLVVGIQCVQQLDRYEVGVGEEVNVMLKLSNPYEASTEVTITPDLPDGVVAVNSGVRSVELDPGATEDITYPIKGVEKGEYAIFSKIVYINTSASRPPSPIRYGDRYNRRLIVS
ncbi:MAG: hypothetical protein U9N48_06865 [Euryarchaeota archaeon]|nr:hypothetical protein [Euryarchaeota archaeon]